MLGSPPSTAFSTFLDAGSSSVSGAHDYLPAWSRSMSDSPLLLPTAVDGSGQAEMNGPSSGLELFGGDPMQGVELSGLEVIKPDVGTGLSPLMEPTSLASMSMPLDLDLRTSADNLEALLAGGSGSFNSAFKNYQPSPKQEPSAIRPSPSTRSLSLDSPAPLSFANVSALTSQSPTTAPPQPNVSSEPAPFATASIRSPTLATPKTATTAIAPSFAEGLPTGLQRRATAGESAEQDHTRIQAYAKLEFPSFDIYIQKLSVTIGRRPTAPTPVSAPLSFDIGGGASQLADYILGLGAPQVKQEDSPAPVDPVISVDDKGKGKAVDESPIDLLRSPPPSNAQDATAPLPSIAFPSIPIEPPSEPIASTSALPVELTPIPTTPLEPSPPITDVDLGPIRAVSRQHARLAFDYDAGAWVLEVLGRNGVVVEGKWRAKGQRVLLNKKTKIQIAERIFHFVLPTVDAPPTQGRKVSTSRKRSAVFGEGKGKSKAREIGDASPALSDHSRLASDRDFVLRALDPSQAGSAAPAPPTVPTALPSLPPLPGHSATASPLHTRSPSLCAPAHSLAPSPASHASPSLPPLPSEHLSNHPITRGSTRPRPPPSKPKIRSPAPPQPVEPPSEYALEIGRQRAAMIAHILSGQQGGTGKNALVKAAAAAAVAQRRAGGKGKGAGLPAAGKGPGKGKGLPPRPRRPSNVSWDDEDEEEPVSKQPHEGGGDSSSSSSSSSDSDDSDGDDDEDDAMDGANMAGGKKSVQKRQSASSLKAAAAAAAALGPGAASAPSPSFVARKQPAKQPKRNPPVSAVQKTPIASPAPPPLPSSQPTPSTLPPSTLPGLPFVLPALPGGLPPLPGFGGSPSLSASSTLKGGLTPLVPPSSLPIIPTTTSAPSPAPSSAPPSQPPAPSASFGGLLLPGAGTRPAPAPSTATPPPPLPAKKPKAAKKVTAGKGKTPKAAVAAEVGGETASPNGGKAPAAKARGSPYTPAPLLAGLPLPNAAPANNPAAKPPYTYASLIAQAVQSAPGKRLSLQGVYDWVLEKWPYFKENQAGWQNTIRHNLTPQRGFVKVASATGDASKGTFWSIDPVQLANFDGHHFRFKKVGDSPSTGTGKTVVKSASSASPAPSAASPGRPPLPTGVSALAASSAPATARSVASTSTAGSARPSPSPGPSIPAVAPNPAFTKPVPIVVGPVPKNYVKPPPVIPKGGAAEGFLTALLDNPPIIFHDESLILNPTIFGHLTTEQLTSLQAMTANDALRILQPYVLQHFTKTAAAAKAAGSIKAATGALGKSPAHGLVLPSRSTASPVPPAATTKKPTNGTTPSSTTPASMKRGREPDIDLSASTSGPAPKVAKKAAARKK